MSFTTFDTNMISGAFICSLSAMKKRDVTTNVCELTLLKHQKSPKIPKEINTLVNSIRRNHQPTMLLDFACGKRVLEARKKSWLLQNEK
jgi:hypothetical protein